MIYLRPSRKIADATTQGGGTIDSSLIGSFIIDSDSFRLQIESSNGTRLDKATKGTLLSVRLFSSTGVDITDRLATARPLWSKKRANQAMQALGAGWKLNVTEEMLEWHTYIGVQLDKNSIISALAASESGLYPQLPANSYLSAEIALVSELPIYRDILHPDIIARPVKDLLVRDNNFISSTKTSPFAFNLVKGGGKPFHRTLDANSNYMVHSWLMDDKSLSGEWYTVVAKLKFIPKVEGKSWLSFYLGGTSEFWDAGQENGSKRTSARDGIFVFHRRVSVASPELAIYQGGNGWGSNPVEHRGCEIEVDWVAMYKGKHDNPPLEFVPHRSEIKGADGKSVSVEEIKPHLILGLKADTAFISATKGDKGDAGAKGDRGLQGIQGIKGSTGAKGADGVSPSPSDVAIAFSRSPEFKAELGKQIKPTVDRVDALTPTWQSVLNANDVVHLPDSRGEQLGKSYIFDFAAQENVCPERYGHVYTHTLDILVDTRLKRIPTTHFGMDNIASAPISPCGGSYYEFKVIQLCHEGRCRQAWLWCNYLDLTVPEEVESLKGRATLLETAMNSANASIGRLEGTSAHHTTAIARIESKVDALPTENNVVGFNASHWDNRGWVFAPVIGTGTGTISGAYTAKKGDGFLFVRPKGLCTDYTITLPSDAGVGTILYIRTSGGAACTIKGKSGASLSGRARLANDELAMCVCSGGNGSEWILNINKIAP